MLEEGQRRPGELELPQEQGPAGGGVGGLSHPAHSRHPHPRTHRHALCLPPRSAVSEIRALPPRPCLPALPREAIAPPLSGQRRAGQGVRSGTLLPHPTDGTLGHVTFLAEEMLVDVNVLVLSRSFKIQDVIHHVLFSLLP